MILDGTVIKTRLDRKATNISVLAAIGVRRDGQKVLLSIRNMGGESTAAWRGSGGFRGRTAATVRPHLDDLDARGLKRPEFVIVAPGGARSARRRAGPGGRTHRAVGRRAADPALHRAQ